MWYRLINLRAVKQARLDERQAIPSNGLIGKSSLAHKNTVASKSPASRKAPHHVIEPAANHADAPVSRGMEVSMKRLMISTFATIALLAAATTMLQSHSAATSHPSVTAGMVSLQELHA